MPRDTLNALNRFPRRNLSRCLGALWYPTLRPKFILPRSARVFTIGSCFARHVEECLASAGIEIATRDYHVPKTEWPYRPQGILNEYNPASIAQRVQWALKEQSAPRSTICALHDGVIDLLLPSRQSVSSARADLRRTEIAALYSRLKWSDLVVVTLGLIEAWFDREAGVVLSGKPPEAVLKQYPSRFLWYQMDISECTSRLQIAFETLFDRVPNAKVLLTVSPVPLLATFSEDDAITANSYSKAVLRVCAHLLRDKHGSVDYYPAYEMVEMAGPDAFDNDGVHVRDAVVREVTSRMLNLYFPER